MQSFAKWPNMILIMFPSACRVGVDRLSDLVVARSNHWAGRFVKIQAMTIPFQPTMAQ